jgi:hypothetical protein
MSDEYKIPQPEGASELREPAVATYYPGVRAAVEPWAVSGTDGLDDDGIDWDSIGVPESLIVRDYDDLKRKLDEGLASLQAGLGIPHEEIEREFLREIESGVYGKI